MWIPAAGLALTSYGEMKDKGLLGIVYNIWQFIWCTIFMIKIWLK